MLIASNPKRRSKKSKKARKSGSRKRRNPSVLLVNPTKKAKKTAKRRAKRRVAKRVTKRVVKRAAKRRVAKRPRKAKRAARRGKRKAKRNPELLGGLTGLGGLLATANPHKTRSRKAKKRAARKGAKRHAYRDAHYNPVREDSDKALKNRVHRVEQRTRKLETKVGQHDRALKAFDSLKLGSGRR